MENNNNVMNVENINQNSDSMDEHVNILHGKVKNLSTHQLTEHERALLELGPKFCPIEHDLNRARFQRDLNAGFRRMRLKAHFYPDDDSRTE